MIIARLLVFWPLLAEAARKKKHTSSAAAPPPPPSPPQPVLETYTYLTLIPFRPSSYDPYDQNEPLNYGGPAPTTVTQFLPAPTVTVTSTYLVVTNNGQKPGDQYQPFSTFSVDSQPTVPAVPAGPAVPAPPVTVTVYASTSSAAPAITVPTASSQASSSADSDANDNTGDAATDTVLDSTPDAQTTTSSDDSDSQTYAPFVFSTYVPQFTSSSRRHRFF